MSRLYFRNFPTHLLPSNILYSNCEDWHQCLAIDEECSYCKAGRGDGLRKRLLARRSQANLPVPSVALLSGGGKVGAVEVDDNSEDLFGIL